MTEKFTLTPGEKETFKKLGTTYTISCDLFKDHDHEKKPIYYYHDGMKDDDLVATVEDDSQSHYDSPYSSRVDCSWSVFREKVVIHFTKENDYLNVEIEELFSSRNLPSIA